MNIENKVLTAFFIVDLMLFIIGVNRTSSHRVLI
jgi:hypothetical protein